MKLVTWNCNGFRKHTEEVTRLLREVDPDVLCLQETHLTTSVASQLFPERRFEGYTVYTACAQRAFHGTAVLLRSSWAAVSLSDVPFAPDLPLPPPQVTKRTVECFKSVEAAVSAEVCPKRLYEACHAEGRVLALIVTPPDSPPFVLVNVYVPNSGVRQQQLGKLSMRIQWNQYFQEYLQAVQAAVPDLPLVVTGDLNVAKDVYRSYPNYAGATWVERRDFDALLMACRLTDAAAPQGYTFFSSPAMQAKGQGWRLDYVLLSTGTWRVDASRVLREWVPKDHCPIEVECAASVHT